MVHKLHGQWKNDVWKKILVQILTSSWKNGSSRTNWKHKTLFSHIFVHFALHLHGICMAFACCKTTPCTNVIRMWRKLVNNIRTSTTPYTTMLTMYCSIQRKMCLVGPQIRGHSLSSNVQAEKLATKFRHFFQIYWVWMLHKAYLVRILF